MKHSFHLFTNVSLGAHRFPHHVNCHVCRIHHFAPLDSRRFRRWIFENLSEVSEGLHRGWAYFQRGSSWAGTWSCPSGAPTRCRKKKLCIIVSHTIFCCNSVKLFLQSDVYLKFTGVNSKQIDFLTKVLHREKAVGVGSYAEPEVKDIPASGSE